MRLYKRIILVIFCLELSGCVTAQSSKAPSVDPSVLKGYQAKINSLEMELTRLKDENYSVRKQLESLQKRGVRMPTGMEIQTALKKAGYFQGVIDGKIGTATKEAVKKFQAANNLNPDGTVGSKTWALLVKYIENQ
jgi:murein L,D-transpeptidase YcbB/YkuD